MRRSLSVSPRFGMLCMLKQIYLRGSLVDTPENLLPPASRAPSTGGSEASGTLSLPRPLCGKVES